MVSLIDSDRGKARKPTFFACCLQAFLWVLQLNQRDVATVASGTDMVATPFSARLFRYSILFLSA